MVRDKKIPFFFEHGVKLFFVINKLKFLKLNDIQCSADRKSGENSEILVIGIGFESNCWRSGAYITILIP